MNKTELKAYLSVLKGNTARGMLPVLEQVAVVGGEIMTTNLDRATILKANVIANAPADGLYPKYMLDGLAQGLEVATDGDVSDYPELPRVEGKTCTLTPEVIEHIIKAADFTSKDTVRPVLGCVALMSGKVYGTDGYILYRASGVAVDAYLTAELVKAFKKVAKYGTWELTANDDAVKLSNGTITLLERQIDALYPEAEKIFPTWYDAEMTVDLTRAKLEKRDVVVYQETEGVEKGRGVDSSTRMIVMPRNGEFGTLELDLKLLSRMTKSNNLTLLYNKNRMWPVEVIENA